MGKRLLKDLAEQLIRSNIIIEGDVVYNFESEPLVINIPGFYKSNGAQLVLDNGEVVAITRYNQVDKISSIQDLVLLNYKWWGESKRIDSAKWPYPDIKWSSLLLEHS